VHGIKVNEINEIKNGAGSGVTVRSVLIGLGLVVLSTLWSVYNVHILWSSGLSMEFFPLAAAFMFFALVFLNAIAKIGEGRLGGKINWALTGRELLVILIMLLVGSTIITRGIVGTWIGNIACVRYRADAINQWGRHLLPHLPWWATTSKLSTAEAVYDGVISGRSAPWGDFIVPVFWWGCFFISLMATNFFIIAILRRQWVEEERLSFPIAEVPVEMVRGMDKRGGIPTILKNRLFWIGMAFPIIHIGMRILHFHIPAVPGDPLRIMIHKANLPLGFERIWLQFDWAVMGFAFLAKLDILFSLVLFYWIYFLEKMIFTRLGVTLGATEKMFPWPDPSGFQMVGALFVMVLTTLWLGRRHLKAVFLKAFRPSHDYDDSGELVSSRTAVFGLIAGLVFMGVWMSKAGMEWFVILAFIPLYLVITIGLTRAVAESGMIWFGAPGIAQHMMISAMGPAMMSVASLVTLGMTWSWHSDMRIAFMPAVAHSARSAGLGGIRRRKIGPLVFIAAILAFGVGTYYTLQLCFEYGGRAMDRRMFGVWGSDNAYKSAKRCVSARGNSIRAKMELACADGAIDSVKTALANPAGLSALKQKVAEKRDSILSVNKVSLAMKQKADLAGALLALKPFITASRDAPPGENARRTLSASLDQILAWKSQYKIRSAEKQLFEYFEGYDGSGLEKAKVRNELKYQLEAADARITDRIQLDRTLAKIQVLEFKNEILDKLIAKKSLTPVSAALSDKIVGMERLLAASENLDIKALKVERRKLELKIPEERGLRGLLFFGSGAAVAVVNYAMRLRLSWWPIHPVGIAFGTVWPMEVIWLSLLLAWLVKLVILKTGGIRLYNQAKPFFIGFIVGGLFMTGFGSLIDTIFYSLPRGGHRLIYW